MTPFGLNTFESDQINLLVGFDKAESKDVVAWSQQYAGEFPFRLAFAINQCYPELRSGFYRNRRLMALIQDAMLVCGLHVVIEDNFAPHGLFPVELPGALETADDYLLIDEGLKVQGRLNVWESQGGKSAFYHDRLIMEVLLNRELGERLIEGVRDKVKFWR
jgi:hypothetical protein